MSTPQKQAEPLQGKIPPAPRKKPPTSRAAPRRRIPCKLSRAHSDHPLVMKHGEKTVTKVFEDEAGNIMWILEDTDGHVFRADFSTGIFRFYNGEFDKEHGLKRLYEKQLPTTLSKLVEETDAWTYLP